MDPAFWRERWKNQDIGFHQPEFHALLQKYWSRLDLRPSSPVFVPLCGKSLDMVWLAQQGHRVIGAELSELAIDDFFAERGLNPTARTAAHFTVKSAGAYELWCGDVFELPREAVTGVAGVYDRAALIALPRPLREQYAEKLKALLPAQAPVLLITLEYEQPQMSGPPFSVPRREVRELFAGSYDCAELACHHVLESHQHFKQRGLTALEECVFLLQRTSS
jgi:thiopurine S-methyltransferase